MCTKFDLLENEFIREPSDLAAYIYRITEELHKVGIRMIQETLEDMDEMLNKSVIRKKKWVVHQKKLSKINLPHPPICCMILAVACARRFYLAV